jgi:polyhydroxybutyrate depolymerase
MKRMFVVLALAAVALGCRGVRAQTGDRTISLVVGGRTRTAIVHVPPGYVPGRPTPVVLLLHGGGGNGAQAERSYGMNPIADREGFLVVYPNGTSRGTGLLTWNAANCCAFAYENDVDDVGFISALLDELEREYAVDARRIYATGMSNGAMMTYRLGCRLANRLAAIAPVAGALNETSCEPAAPLPVIVFHGTADQHVPYDGGMGAASLYPHVDTPVSAAVSFWVQRDKCRPAPSTETSPSGRIRTDTYGGGVGGAEVVLYTVIGGGHAWPGGRAGSALGDTPTQEISASELMWAFFARHPKPDPTAPAVPVVHGESHGSRGFHGPHAEAIVSVHEDP